MKKKIAITFSTIFFALFIYACSTGINIFSIQDEKQLGKQFHNEVTNNPDKYPVYDEDPSIKNYVKQRIMDHLLNSSPMLQNSKYNYTLTIIDNDSTLNAFAVPGGYIYLYTGILEYLDSEAALAGVVAHEIAHVEKRHSTQRLTSAYGMQILLSVALGNNPSQIASIVANLFSGVTMLAYSREMEDESDEFGVKYLEPSRYYPGSVKFFFEKMKADGKLSGNNVPVFLSTHPEPENRISNTNKRVRELGYPVISYDSQEKDLYRDEYQRNILNKLK